MSTPQIKAQVTVTLLTDGTSEDTYLGVTYTCDALTARNLVEKAVSALDGQMPIEPPASPLIVSPNGVRE